MDDDGPQLVIASINKQVEWYVMVKLSYRMYAQDGFHYFQSITLSGAQRKDFLPDSVESLLSKWAYLGHMNW